MSPVHRRILTGTGDAMRAGNRKPELYRWRRQSTDPKTKAAFDYDNVEHWIKRVEQASEFAVSEVFSPKKPTQRAQRPPHSSLTLQSVDQLHDHDDAYTEAQDLLSGWLSNKLKVELASDDDADPEVDIMEPSRPSPPEFIKYSRFDDLYNYLEKETESANTQDFLQTLLQKEVADSGILESLKSEKITNTKQKDLRITMELRHQQVKENRARRQRETERRRQELALKKSALSEAQTLLQEENKQKALKAKKEEEEIQREMVKLRKEMGARRRVMEEARRAEVKRNELQKKEPVQPASQEPERRLAKRGKIQELLHQIYAENHRCLQNHFSAWYKLVLERRVKMGKARALADWRLQLRTFRAWRDHMWSGKMERETRQMEKDLRDQNRKLQAAAECYSYRLLRRCLAEWQLWCRGEKEKRELEAQKEETKRKMAALLDAASSVGGRRQSNQDQTGVTVSSHEASKTQVETSRSAKTKAPITSHKTGAEKLTAGPRHAWQVTLQHASLTPEELQQHRLQHRSAPQGSGHHRKIPPYGENFENRHTFQQNLIEEQRRQLQEQKEMILGLMENQRLMIAQREAKNATAVTAELSGRSVPARVTHRTGSAPPTPSRETPPRLPLSSKPSERPNTSPPQSTTPRRNGSSTPHPAVTAMEERAVQRAERRRLLEEMRRRREEEKLAELRAAEERRLQMELAEKEAQLEKKREEKRLQRQKEEEKQRRLQKEEELLRRAERHNEQRLLRSCGLEPWRKLLVQRRQNAERAESHHCLALLRRGLLGWSQAARELLSEKVRRAEQLHTTLLLRRIFRHWLKYKDYLSVQEERAVRRHRANLQRRTFLSWLNVAQEEKMATWEKQRTAAEHNQRRILLSALRTWRRLPEEMRALRLQEERRDALRKRVAELLPDFTMNREM
ncbi:coiled-coil domain-containing protein 191 isoform X2 [Ranitomeya variabilis]|uniref:coiled-coil domain-containing protein 191 isoform X2 n=1 Tax=Ranitomeya variabilis TaxID=490064 RepID=UPI004056B956